MATGDGHVLFVERASAVRPGFQPDHHVDAICDAVDQLPLAIELAAARVRALSPAAIHERLTQKLELLASRDRDIEERQRTLEATIAWSYDLLSEEEQSVLRSLSVFAGGCTLIAAEAVAGADLDSIESLLDKSLVRHRIDEAGQDRYWMLETIREYAQRELERAGEVDAAGIRHTAYFADLAVRVDAASTYVMSDAHRDLYLSDRANFNEAHARALTTSDGASALQFVRRLARATQETGSRARDWYARCAASIALPGGAREDRAWALVRTARIAGITGDFAQARSWLDEADVLLEELEDLHGSADALGARCLVELSTGNFDQTLELAEQLAALVRILPDADRAGAESEAEWALANGRFLDEPSWTRTARRQNVVELSSSHARTPPLRGRCMTRPAHWTTLPIACSCSVSIRTGSQQRSARCESSSSWRQRSSRRRTRCPNLSSRSGLLSAGRAKPTWVSSSSVPRAA